MNAKTFMQIDSLRFGRVTISHHHGVETSVNVNVVCINLHQEFLPLLLLLLLLLLCLCVPSKLKSRHAVIRPIPSACLNFSFEEQVRNRNSIRK